MSKDTVLDFITRLENQPPSRRSKAYAWLYEHASEIEALFARHRPSWTAVANELAAAGICGAKNQHLSAHSLRQIWQRVCRDLKAERRYQATGVKDAPKSIHPSRVPKSWRPEETAPERAVLEVAHSARASPQPALPIATDYQSLQPATYIQREGEKHWDFMRRITIAAKAKDAEKRTPEEKRAIVMDEMYRRSGHP